MFKCNFTFRACISVSATIIIYDYACNNGCAEALGVKVKLSFE